MHEHELDSDLHQLIGDTLVFLKDPLLPKQTFFTSVEQLAFFRSKASSVPPQPKEIAKKQDVPIRSSFKVEKPISPIQEPIEKVEAAKTPSHQAPKYIPSTSMQPQIKEATSPKAPDAAQDLKLAPKPPIKASDLIKVEGSEQIKKTLLRMVPHIKLVDDVPDDTKAKKIASGWKEKIPDAEVILLACETDADTLDLLKSLGRAIDQNLAKAKIVPAEKLEQENRWDIFLQKNQFRLIIASDGMKKHPELMKFYHANPAQSQSFLDKTPLLALSPASIYKLIEHKAHLWKTLCQMLKK